MADVELPLERRVLGELPIRGMETVVVTVTGYHGSERFNLIKLIDRCGANFVGYLNDSITHLVCWRFEGKKYDLAKKLKVKVVNHRWIEACIRENKRVLEDLYTDKCGEEVGTLSLDIAQFAEKERSQYFSNNHSKIKIIDTDSEDSAPICWTNCTLLNENEDSEFSLLPRERRKNIELGESSHRRPMLVKNNMKKNRSSSSLNPDNKCSRRQIIDELSDGTTASDGPPSSNLLAKSKKRRLSLGEREISWGGRRLVKKNASVDKPIFILDPEQEHNHALIIDERSDNTATHSSALRHDREVGARQTREVLEEIPEVTDVTYTVSIDHQHVALPNSSLCGRELAEEWSFPNGCSNEIEQGAQASKRHEISCVICITEFNIVRGRLLCGHQFCFQCIYDWARACLEKRKPPRCPLCKASFETIRKYTHTADNLDQKVYTQTNLSENFGTDVSVYADNQAPIVSEFFNPYDQMPVQPNPLAERVCCRCTQNEFEELLESCNVCQRLCVHRYCLDPPLLPWTCDCCKDLQTLHRRRLIC